MWRAVLPCLAWFGFTLPVLHMLHSTHTAWPCLLQSAGMWDRLTRTEEKIVMLPSLQEMTINPDGISITPTGQHPKVTIP